MASNLGSDIRHLEGAVTRLVAYSTIMGSEIDLPKELEDYMIEWDFYNGDHKLEW